MADEPEPRPNRGAKAVADRTRETCSNRTPCVACAQSANHPKQPKTTKGRKAPEGPYAPAMESGASCGKWSPTRFDPHKAQWLKEIGVMD